MTPKQFNKLLKAIATGCQCPAENYHNGNIHDNCVIGSMLLHAGLSEGECLNAGIDVGELSIEHKKLLMETYGLSPNDLAEMQIINDSLSARSEETTKARREQLADYVCQYRPKEEDATANEAPNR